MFERPGGFKKFREVYGKNFLQISSKSDFMLPSYDQKAKMARLLTSRVLKFEPKKNLGNPFAGRPFILTRDAIQKQVFGMGYPSLPSMSVEGKV